MLQNNSETLIKYNVSDTGAPYVLYKDGMERGGGMQLQGAMQWGPSQDTYVQQGSTGSGSPSEPLDTPQEPASSLVSPVPSPYPEPQTHSIQGLINSYSRTIYKRVVS